MRFTVKHASKFSAETQESWGDDCFYLLDGEQHGARGRDVDSRPRLVGLLNDLAALAAHKVS